MLAQGFWPARRAAALLVRRDRTSLGAAAHLLGPALRVRLGATAAQQARNVDQPEPEMRPCACLRSHSMIPDSRTAQGQSRPGVVVQHAS